MGKKQFKPEINEIFTNVFTDKFINKINAGATLKELSREYGIGYSLLRNLKISLEEKGLLKKVTLTQHKINAIAQNRKDELIEYFKLGKNIKFISEKIGYKDLFVKGALKIVLSDGQEPLTDHELKALMFENRSSLKNEITIEREKQKQERLKNKFSSGRYREINELRNQGKTFEEIGQKFNLTRERIRQLIKKIETNAPYENMKVMSMDEIREATSFARDNKRNAEVQKILSKSEQQIIDLVAKGNSPSKINEFLDITLAKHCIKKLKSDGKIKDGRMGSKINEQEVEIRHRVIIKGREEGKSLLEIANELGVSKPTISNLIREMRDKGIYISDNHRLAGRSYSRDWATIDYRTKIIKKMKAEGKGSGEIAKFLGVDVGAISRHIKTYMN
tara:strand:+ start:2550 stop:3722 length:1173 start_codon:yes stop_codon:yes gene_type:complete